MSGAFTSAKGKKYWNVSSLNSLHMMLHMVFMCLLPLSPGC